ncbi:hypothetical protein E4U41_003967 [Claviceps citrina]|nr:hypothetical protein E4U41_003967 [Claviceps citrina]
MFGKKKMQDDEPKPEVDLATALPSSDDFRTSLLMTGLSARFSMLREQDDPHSKLGKASDDSVLHPKRQSRLVDFGASGGGLHDIAEVESLRAPHSGRFDSYQSDDASSMTGSVMSRAKPTEGNNLFGGRQKIYKLAAGSRAGMSGRALYDDDVAQSSFQRWRQAEKERNLAEEQQSNSTFEAEPTPDFNRRRETSSTTSSAPSAGRNSTAATSISSQPSSVKDTYSAAHMPGLERSVTRTRRLYEQGLTQDLHDHQSSALTRIDILAKQRPFGSRTPDPASAIPSPTASNFGGDRVAERHPIISKASAPNLRSFSPSAMSSSQISPAESATNKVPRVDHKPPSFGSNPPLSPPISETEEPSGLVLQPGDRGKATAMGVFNRPTVHYDESRYAQRQRQLQQGRDVSVPKNTTASVASSVRARSRSSSAQRAAPERMAPKAPLPIIPVLNRSNGSTVFDDSDDDASANHSRPEISAVVPHLNIERPDDQDHPALRRPAVPTPLSISLPNDLDGQASSKSGSAQTVPPEDSPTLGPNGGLSVSGMIRHHLRNHSGASSMYGATEQHEAEPDGKERTGDDTSPGRSGETNQMNTEEGRNGDGDEFAQHLADGARRVRERLTTYVETDPDHSAPPTPPQSEQNKEFGSSKSSGLGTLRAKSSRGSLLDRSEKERGRAKGWKTPGSQQPGIGGGPPSPRKASGSRGPSRNRAETIDQGEMATLLPEDNAHAGLKAFRQARRELQKMKELEVQHRRGQRPSPHQEHPPNGRLGHYENGPPPALFNRMPRGDDEACGGRSRAASRATSERDRSGSETSNGGRNYSRGPRLRNGSVTYDERFGKAGAHGAAGPDAQRVVLESPNRPPHMVNGPTCEPNGRYYAPGMPSAAPHDSHQYGRSRNGSFIGAAVSTPNLRGSAPAPPLPPINPRRKNGFARCGEEGPGGTSVGKSLGMTDGFAGDEDAAGDHFRRAKTTGGQMRHSPPMALRPPMPHSQMSSASLPGGMF